MAEGHEVKGSYHFDVYCGLITPEHRERMDSAVWEYLWCLDHQTGEDGLVLGGKPIKISEINVGLDESQRRRNLKRLEANGYISLKRAPYGIIIRVLKQKKFSQKRSCIKSRSESKSDRAQSPDLSKEIVHKVPISQVYSPDLSGIKSRSNKDFTVDFTVDLTKGTTPPDGGCRWCAAPKEETFGTQFLLQCYHDRFKEHLGECPVLAPGKDGALFAKLRESGKTDAQILEALEEFFKDSDGWVVDSGYTVQAFYSRFQGMRLRVSGKGRRTKGSGQKPSWLRMKERADAMPDDEEDEAMR